MRQVVFQICLEGEVLNASRNALLVQADYTGTRDVGVKLTTGLQSVVSVFRQYYGMFREKRNDPQDVKGESSEPAA